MDATTHETSHQSRRAKTIAATLIAVLAALLVWAAVDMLLLLFAALLVALLLLAISGALHRWTSLPRGWSLAATCLGLVGLLALGAVMLAPVLAEQARSLGQSLPHSLEQARAVVRAGRLGDWLGDAVPTADELRSMAKQAFGGFGALRRLTGVFTTAVGAVASTVLVVLLGVFFAAQPRTYREGLVRLVPPPRRARTREVLAQIGDTLQWWLLGKLVSMTLVGALSSLGLWLLGVPFALALGLIAALLGFIPNFGPVLAVIPAALVALSQSPAAAGYVVLLYLGIQTVESYVITPLIQQRALALPPGLILATQLVVGGLLGALGLALATPLLSAAVILIETLYVEDVLQDRPHT